MVEELTWQQIDQRARDLEAKKRECVERLSRVLSKEFAGNELRLIWGAGPGFPSSIITEAFEIARTRTAP
jgi:hypothetical protein